MARVLIYPSLDNLEAVEGICNQERLWSDCEDEQANLSLCCLNRKSHKSYCRFCCVLAQNSRVERKTVVTQTYFWNPCLGGNWPLCKQCKFRCHCSYEQWHLNFHCLQKKNVVIFIMPSWCQRRLSLQKNNHLTYFSLALNPQIWHNLRCIYNKYNSSRPRLPLWTLPSRNQPYDCTNVQVLLR